MTRAPERPAVLAMIDAFYDPLIERGVEAPVPDKAVMLAEAA